MKPEIKIISENDHFMVIYKPAGIPVQTSSVRTQDVCSILKNHLKGGYLGVVHRLDQPVEGLLVFAKDKRTAALLSDEIAKGKLKKSYVAVTYGEGPEMGTDVCYMKKTSDNLCVIGEGEEFKRAELHYELLGRKSGTSLYRIEIATGRFHQIRAQMNRLGLPLLGDMKYGNDESRAFSEKLGITSPALCADRLCIYDPSDGSEEKFCVLPDNPAYKIYDQNLFEK
ncbi:MAG: RNA pseudouridine synthase [Lachnospiraceae bacterium]|nr:RNA pseudouridine synthase [Lachnospiraceae bacterium]